MEQINEFTVPEELDDERLDAVVASLSEGQSRSYLKNLIKDGSVLLNGKTAKPSARVRENDKITLVLPEKIIPDILPENIPLDILYEDEDVLVVNKPKGMVVHPAPGHYSGTLVNAVMYHCGSSLSGINGVMRPGIVHRIDRDTTGSVIICKNDAAHNSIAAQLQEHSIVRRYFAILYDNIPEDEFTVDAPIGRDPKDRKRMTVRRQGGPIRSVFIWPTCITRYWEMKYMRGGGNPLLRHRGSVCMPGFSDLFIPKQENTLRHTRRSLSILKKYSAN